MVVSRCSLVYSAPMATTEKAVRQSVTLPSRVARRVRSLARVRKTSTSRVLVDLIESGLESKDRERQQFLQLAERLAQSKDRAEQARLKEDLARITFGE
mgnify:CR=1 FL=1